MSVSDTGILVFISLVGMESSYSDDEEGGIERVQRGSIMRTSVVKLKKPLKNWDVAFYGAPQFYRIDDNVIHNTDRTKTIVAANVQVAEEADQYFGNVHGVYFNPRSGCGADDAQGATEFLVEGVYVNIMCEALLPKSVNVSSYLPYVTEPKLVVWIELLHIPGDVCPWDEAYGDPGYNGGNGHLSGYPTWKGLYQSAPGRLDNATVYLRNEALRRGVKSVFREEIRINRPVINMSGRQYDGDAWVTSDQAVGVRSGKIEGVDGTGEFACLTQIGEQHYYKSFPGQIPEMQAAWGPVQTHYDALGDIYTSQNYYPINRVIVTKDNSDSHVFRDMLSKGSFVVAAWSNQQVVNSDHGHVYVGESMFQQLPQVDINMRFRFRQK